MTVASAQNPSPVYFSHYGMEAGLASNEIFSVTQDRAGYLWVGTNNGLQRFDGVQFVTFRHIPGNTKTIPSNVVISVTVDAKDRLWVINHGGEIGQVDKYTFAYKAVPVTTRAAPSMLFGEKRLIEDEYGNLFLSIRGNDLLKYDERTGAFVAIQPFIPVDTAWGFTSMSQQPGTHKYWMGLQTGGLAIYNRNTGTLSYTGHNTEREPAIEALGPKSDFAFSFFDSRGRLWFQTWGGGFPLCKQYNPQRSQKPLREYEFITALKTYHEFRGVMQEKDGRVWVYGSKLLAWYNEAEESFEIIPNDYNNGQGIVYESITTMFQDREKNVWVGTHDRGLYRFNPSQQFFTNVYHHPRVKKGLGDGSVMSFAQLRNGDLLAGTWEDGLFRYNSQFKSLPLGIRDSAKMGVPYIWGMCHSADSNSIWMSAQPGLYLFDQAKNSIWFRNPPVLKNHTIRQVVEDKKGNLWLGMHAFGLYRWIDPKTRRRDSVVNVPEVGAAMINKLMTDKRGQVWVGTGNSGLFLFDGNSGRLLKRWHKDGTAEGKLMGNSIMGLIQYNDSVTTIATLNQLFLYNYRTGTVSQRRLPDDVMGNIAALEKDDDGFIWISTSNALYRVHPSSKAVLMYNRFDGIGSDRFTLSASYKMRDGRLLFGTTNSFIAFHPRQVGVSNVAPTVYITGIQVGKRDVRVDSVLRLDRLVLPAADNFISVDVSTFQFSTSQFIQYKMDGIDEEWHTVEGAKRIAYPYLPSGRYTLHLRSVSTEGTFSAPTILRVRVRPPWYQSWWFYTLVAFAFIAELWWLDRQRSRRKQGMEKVRTDIASGLHEEVNTALNNINILSEIARLKSDREPQKAKEYLEQIHTKSHNMIIAMDDMLWSLNPENDAMEKTISRIREYADALMQRHNVLIELLIDKKVEKLALNMKLRHEAFLLFKEGLRSLVEAGTRHCIVHLAAERTKLFFTIEFANEGCNMQQLNNLLQRRDMELRIQSLHAKLDVQLHKSRSMFLLQLPLGNGG